MKAHIGTDAKSKLIHTIKTTTAKVHDSEVLTNFFTEKSTPSRRQSICQQGEEKTMETTGKLLGSKKSKQKGEPSHPLKRKTENTPLFVRESNTLPYHQVFVEISKGSIQRTLQNTVQIFTLCFLANLHRVRHSFTP